MGAGEIRQPLSVTTTVTVLAVPACATRGGHRNAPLLVMLARAGGCPRLKLNTSAVSASVAMALKLMTAPGFTV